MPKSKSGTREEILTAARNEFIAKGLAGARTKVIAEHIGVTKAMIHYYFDTKENLFKEVFRAAAGDLLEGTFDVLEEDLPLFKKIEHFIDALLDHISSQARAVRFVIGALNHQAEITEPLFEEICSYDAAPFREQLEDAAADYTIVAVEADQLIANTVALCIFPYSGRNFMRLLLRQDEDAYDGVFLTRRRELIKDTVINGLAG